MRRKWRATWTTARMYHSIEFSTIGGTVRDAENWLKIFLKDVKFDFPDVYHLQELDKPPEPTKFHSVLTWPYGGREGILWVAPA